MERRYTSIGSPRTSEEALKSSDLARPAGFEPATRCLEGSCSVRLSYGRSNVIVYGEDHATATRRSQCVGLEAAPPRETLTVSFPRAPPAEGTARYCQRRAGRARRAANRITGRPSWPAQRRSSPAITSESRLLRHGKSGWRPAGALMRSGIGDPKLIGTGDDILFPHQCGARRTS